MKNQIKEMAEFLQNTQRRTTVLTEAEYFYRDVQDWNDNSPDQLDSKLIKKIEKVALLLNATPEAVDDKKKEVVYSLNGENSPIISPQKLSAAGIKSMQLSIDNSWGDILVITVLK